MRLSPFDPLAFEAHYAHGVLALHEARYADAATFFAKASQTNAGTGIANFAHAVALALGGRLEEGRAICAQHPERTPREWSRVFSETGVTREILEKYAQGARLLEASD